MKAAQLKRVIIDYAKNEGDRIVIDGKNVWMGLGNRSGLHDFQWTLIREKYEKSGARFEKKLDALLIDGAKVEIHTFRNIDRNRGRWIVFSRYTVDNAEIAE
jgi:N-dimethylarginine dimethylaminohydrolase